MKNFVIIFLVVILIGGSIWYLSLKTSEEAISPEQEITSFEECLTAGYLIIESYPRQCQVPGGEIFTEEIEMEEESTVEEEQACIDSGGTVENAVCCLATTDFPNICLIGPCGCSPENSHEIKICNCGEGKCFDGNTCVTVQ
jgi:hypothetical protein